MADDLPFASIKFVKPDGKGVDLAPTVESVDVEDHDRAIDRARIVFDDTDGDIAQILREQLRIQVTIGWNSENAMIFEGLVMSPKTEALGNGRQRVTVTAYDLSYRMKQRKPEVFTFNSGKLTDALKAIVKKYESDGISAGDITITPDPSFTNTKQEGQSDWDFIQELARKYRARAFVEVNDSKSKFYFVSEKSLLKGDPMGTLHYCPGGGGEKLVEFTYQRIGSGAAPSSTVTVIDPKTGEPSTKTADPPAPDAPLEVAPDADSQLTQAADVASTAKSEESRPTPVAIGFPSDEDKASRLIEPDPTRIVGFYGTGTAIGTIKLRAKGKVTIKGSAPWAEGDWYVHKVNHIFTRLVAKDKELKEQNRSTYQTKFSATR